MIRGLIAALLIAAQFLSGGPIVRPTQPVTPGPMRIMPLGDSITEGFRSTDGTGYRGPLDRALTRSHVFVGSLTDPKGLPHEGHGGKRLDELAAQAQAWTAAAKPTVVLIEGGTNDVRLGDNGSTMLADLTRLVAAVRAAAPGVTCYIATIPDLPAETAAKREQLRNFNLSFYQLGCRVVDMYSVLGPGDYDKDQIHPNDSGYGKMAAAYAKALA